MVGPTPGKTHEQCLALVCAVCTNLNGKKAERVLSLAEVGLIKKYVFAGYTKNSTLFPTGICYRLVNISLKKTYPYSNKYIYFENEFHLNEYFSINILDSLLFSNY